MTGVSRTSALTIADLDHTFVSARGLQDVLVDLRSVDHIAHETLMYLVGFFHQRTQRGQTTELTLPRTATAVDFLRSWGFPEALQRVTNNRFEYLLDADSRERYSGLPKISRYEKVIFTPDAGREALLPKTFFAITPLSIPLETVPTHVRTSPQRAASLERDRWLQAHVLNVLHYYLDYRGDEVATKVVYEAVLNAAHHPKASMGLVSSQLLRSRDGASFGEPRALEISIWDDGDSFAQTLGARLAKGLSIHAESFGRFSEEFDVRIFGAGGQANSTVKLDSKTRVSDTREEALTVAAFMLGVTSDPERGTSLGKELTDDEQAGSGLYFIRKTVVDKFGGRIRYMTGSSRLELRGAGQRGRYHVQVRNDPARAADIAGNLLVMTIPVDAAKAAPSRPTALSSLAR